MRYNDDSHDIEELVSEDLDPGFDDLQPTRIKRKKNRRDPVLKVEDEDPDFDIVDRKRAKKKDKTRHRGRSDSWLDQFEPDTSRRRGRRGNDDWYDTD